MKISLSGLAAEILQTENIEYTDTRDVKTLLKVLQAKSKTLGSSKLYVTIKEDLVDEKQTFKESDEVFVFNPFAGG